MIFLSQPKIKINEIHSVSYSKTKSSDLQARHMQEAPHVQAASRAFRRAAEEARTEHLARESFQTRYVSADEMTKLYTNSIQRPGSPGRQYYDELMNQVPHKKCPYCSQRLVSSIDHYLPKKEYSALAVTPDNLVPSCTNCNHAKGSYRPTTDEPPLIHPYFDNVEEFRWLYAGVAPFDPPKVRFEVRTEEAPGPDIAARLVRHFELLELNDLFKSHAGEVIEQLNFQLSGIFENGGAAWVRAHLLEQAECWSRGKKNTWLRALFEGLAASDWYCCEYFNNAGLGA